VVDCNNEVAAEYVLQWGDVGEVAEGNDVGSEGAEPAPPGGFPEGTPPELRKLWSLGQISLGTIRERLGRSGSVFM